MAALCADICVATHAQFVVRPVIMHTQLNIVQFALSDHHFELDDVNENNENGLVSKSEELWSIFVII